MGATRRLRGAAAQPRRRYRRRRTPSDLPLHARPSAVRGGQRPVTLRWRCPPASCELNTRVDSEVERALFEPGRSCAVQRDPTMTNPSRCMTIGCWVPGRAVCDHGCRSGRSWDPRSLVLADGDVLHWLAETPSGQEPCVVYYRTDRTGSLPPTAGARLLRQHGHPDAELAQPANNPVEFGDESWWPRRPG
jgi:hypothetical protein